MTNRLECSVADCVGPVVARGYCDKHYCRFKRHGDVHGGRTSPGELLRYYKEVVVKHTSDECLLWQFSRTKRGYAEMRHSGKMVIVSRLVCREVNGEPACNSLVAAHSCGKGHLGCVSPRHLSWKTHAENAADTIAHGASTKGVRHPMAKLNEEQVLKILSLKGQESQRATGKRFGVTQGAISLIHRGVNWPEIFERGAKRDGEAA